MFLFILINFVGLFAIFGNIPEGVNEAIVGGSKMSEGISELDILIRFNNGID
jgi:hypothetical protein